jgi:iron complex outermembrane receptor protein
VFYSHLTDALVTILSAGFNQRQNRGNANYHGGEFSLLAQLTPAFQAGVTHGYSHRTFDVGTAATGTIRPFELTDVPDHKGFAWLSWRPVGGLNVVPNLEFASGRITVTPARANGINPFNYETGGFVTAALRIDYDISQFVTVGIGGRNQFDKPYPLTDGFPEPGRSFFASIRARYKNERRGAGQGPAPLKRSAGLRPLAARRRLNSACRPWARPNPAPEQQQRGRAEPRGGRCGRCRAAP